ncbi:hypothetical protein [Nitrospirillum sp. BR 11828]|uniref:hypothetical protein n=1 Tax=Nitrospirillum sp. BR 11828 TaxID=3104325 RepID=UPI002ACA85B5|nr:hypothetical protein [Nitrospirillum sp. BR 11828]MDZ5649230.1 hypothetical protein [Nitrospirillum sp. BR 11828]
MVSVDSLGLKPGERIVAFHIHVAGGGIRALPHLPMGWSLSIDNDASWQTGIEGGIQLGSAALDPAELQDFLVVETSGLPDGGLRLSGDLVVSDAPGETQRTIALDMAELRQRKIR